jgi:hypothetical protein
MVGPEGRQPPKANVSVAAGWKNALVPKITQMIAGPPHSLYAEPFVGMETFSFGAIRLRKLRSSTIATAT